MTTTSNKYKENIKRTKIKGTQKYFVNGVFKNEPER